MTSAGSWDKMTYGPAALLDELLVPGSFVR